MQRSRQHLRSIPNSPRPGPDSCERRELWRHLILPQHLLPWHSVAGTQSSPSLTRYRHRKNGGERVYLIKKKCSTSESLTCILWVKPARHKGLTDSWQTLWLCPTFSRSFLFGLQSSWSLLDRQTWAGCAAQQWYEAPSAVGDPTFTSDSPQKEQ